MIKRLLVLFAALAWLALSAHAQTITSLAPFWGAIGSTVNINGSGFGGTQGSSTVAFNGTNATVSIWTATQITVTVPISATRGNVVVTVSGTPSNGELFVPTDAWGGRLDISCANPYSGVNFWKAKVGNQWFFCTPGGHAMIAMDTTLDAPEANPTFDCAQSSTGTATAAVWNGGSPATATYTFPTIPANAVVGSRLTTTGFSPSGYNIAYSQQPGSLTANGTITSVSGSQITVDLASNPGTATAYGSGTVNANTSNTTNGVYISKYGVTGDASGTGSNYYWQQERRAIGYGFNSMGILTASGAYAWTTCSYPTNCNWVGGRNPVQLPVLIEIHTAGNGMENVFGYLSAPMKDVGWGSKYWSSSSGFDAAQVAQDDRFGPEANTEIVDEMTDTERTLYQEVMTNQPYITAFDSDNVGTDDIINSGWDFQANVTASNPAMLVMITSPLQAGGQHADYNSGAFYVYTDPVERMKANATNPSHGTCSYTSHPCSLHDALYDEYSGSISSLNTAWGSSYSTFGSSGTCVGYTLPNICGSGSGSSSETITLTSGSYTLANANVDPYSVEITATPTSGTYSGQSFVITADCPNLKSSSCGSSGGGSFKLPATLDGVTGWKERTDGNYYAVGQIFEDSAGNIEVVVASSAATGICSTATPKCGTTASSEPTPPATCSGSQTTSDGQLTELCLMGNVTGTINYGTSTAGSASISLTIGGAGSIPSGITLALNYMYGGWGASSPGTGFLDEDGSHGGTGHNSETWLGTNPSCLEGADPNFPTYFACNGTFKAAPNDCSGATPCQVGIDLDAWLEQFMAQNVMQYHNALRNAPGGSHILYIGPDQISLNGTPMFSKLLIGMSPWVDGAFGDLEYMVPNSSGSFSSSQSAQLSTAYQYLTRYLGDIPIYNIGFIGATADDSGEECTGSQLLYPGEAPNQATRGNMYYETVQYLLSNTGYWNDMPFFGFDMPGWRDSQGTNLGSVDVHDNSYGGSAGESNIAASPCDPIYTSLVGCGLDTGNYGNFIGGSTGSNGREAANAFYLGLTYSPIPFTPAKGPILGYFF